MSSQRPQPVDTPSNHGPIVSVVTWFLLAATVLAVLARFVTKLFVSKRLTSDDLLIFIALALSIGQGVAVSLQTSNGLGQHESALSASQLDNFYKYWERAPSSCCGHSPPSWPLPSNASPRTRGGLPAINVLTEYVLTAVLDHVSDLTTDRIPGGILEFVRGSQPDHGSRATDSPAGHCVEHPDAEEEESDHRLLLRITDSLSFTSHARGTADAAFDTWPVVLSAQVVQSLSIITACIPCLKPFLESLESGMMRVDLRARSNGHYGYGSHNLTNLSSKSNGKKEKSALSSNLSHHKHFRHLPDVSTVISANHDERERDSDSQKSSARIIKYTRTWEVT
ncbi:MAG: hypothetical protein Q9193_003968 [Seirophora villosa]